MHRNISQRLLIIFILTSLFSCGAKHTSLFDEVKELAGMERFSDATLFQRGEEEGFLEPLMIYELYSIDTLSFENLLKSVRENERFEVGSYYLNLELDAFIGSRNLSILNMSNSLITKNKYESIYNCYLFSDRRTFAICKVNR